MTLTTAQDALPNVDRWWLDCARRALETLAAEGREFTAYDLTQMGVPDPDHSSRFGSLFAAAKAEGLIVPVGYLPSPRPTRSGGVCRSWVGVSKPSAPVGKRA